MISTCFTSDIAMLKWIAYVNSISLEFKHVSRKDIAVANMLCRARYDGEEEIIDGEEDVGTNFYSTLMARRESFCLTTSLEFFLKELYEGEWIRVEK